MSGEARTAKKHGALFIQPGGVNNPLVPLRCYDVDDIEETFGDTTTLWCIDENGDFAPVGETESPPDTVTFGLGTYAGPKREALETVKCPVPFYLVMRCGGRADNLDKMERVEIINVRKVTGRTLSQWVRRAEDAEMMTNFTVNAYPGFTQVVNLDGYTQATAEIAMINDIAFIKESRCKSSCGGALTACERGIYVAASNGGLEANTYFTTDGKTWVVNGADPLDPAEDISACEIFTISADADRAIVARGTSVPAEAAQIAYTDDRGATWTKVFVGSTLGQYITTLYAVDRRNIWAGTDDGYIYKSEDAGVTWTAQTSGTISSNAVNEIFFRNNAVGGAVLDGDDFIKTADGGANWVAGTATGSADNLETLKYNGEFWWIGTDGGKLFYSEDDGDTWTQRTGFIYEGTDIQSLDFINEFVGLAVLQDGTSVRLIHTFDGGDSWRAVGMPTTTAGVPARVVMCATDLAFVVGDAGPAGYIVKIAEKA